MSFDGIVTLAVARELNHALKGGRVAKVYQPGETELLLHIRSRGANHKLLLSAHPSYARVHLTETPVDNPVEPPMFCMLLRKHLEGAIVEAVTQVETERILHFDFRTRDELGDEAVRRLVVEIMGRHSNIILIDPASGHIFDAIRRVTPAVSQYRQVLPGAVYIAPPAQNKKNPLTVDRDAFIASFDYNAGRMDKQIVDRFTGIGPLLAREIVHRGGIGSRDRLWEVFQNFMEDARQGRFEPAIVRGKEKSVFAPWPLTHLNGEIRTFATMSACLDAFYTGKAQRDRIRQQTQDLMRKLKNEIEKNEKKVKILRKELAEAEKAEDYRMFGELLTACLHQVKRGDSEARVINYYDPEAPEITIPLDPALSPSENAQRWFKKYNKAKAVVRWNREQIEKAEEDIRYLESVLVQLENANLRDVEEIREELEEQGWLKPQTHRPKRKKKEAPSLTTVYSSDGTPILIGRNNKQNDYLTHQLAHVTDTWLHTKDIPGSHVVIRSKQVSEQTLREAAMLAAWFSKARESSQVPVDYTLIKHVKKPSSARPGFVIYEQQKTLYVTPDEDKVQELLKRTKPPV